MTTIEERVLRLERRDEIVQKMHRHGSLCDEEPYGDRILADWSAEPFLDSGSAIFRGRDELSQFYSSLPASFVVHYLQT